MATEIMSCFELSKTNYQCHIFRVNGIKADEYSINHEIFKSTSIPLATELGSNISFSDSFTEKSTKYQLIYRAQTLETTKYGTEGITNESYDRKLGENLGWTISENNNIVQVDKKSVNMKFLFTSPSKDTDAQSKQKSIITSASEILSGTWTDLGAVQIISSKVDYVEAKITSCKNSTINSQIIDLAPFKLDVNAS